jgi:hypothetical protein
MSVIGQTALTLRDVASRSKDQVIMNIVEMLNQVNEVVPDALWVPCNRGNEHVTTARTGLPQATWRRINKGVASSVAPTAQITESCANLQIYSQVDKKLADLTGNAPALRASEDKGFVEGMSQQVAEALFYGSIAGSPDEFNGLATRFNAIADGGNNAVNIIDMGGTGSTNTSMWVVQWGDDTVHGIFPDGGVAGLQQRDLGETFALDEDGNRYQVYQTLFDWDLGFCVRDWRSIVRLPNIDVTQLSGSTPPDLITGLIRAMEHIPVLGAGRIAIYCNRAIRTWLRVQAASRTNMFLTLEEFAGKRIPSFDGCPIRLCDQLLSTEARIT